MGENPKRRFLRWSTSVFSNSAMIFQSGEPIPNLLPVLSVTVLRRVGCRGYKGLDITPPIDGIRYNLFVVLTVELSYHFFVFSS